MRLRFLRTLPTPLTRTLPLVVCFITLTGVQGWARTIHVSPSGDGSSGNTWATAYPEIHTALSVSATGDRVLVGMGVYVENIDIKESVSIIGGYEGISEEDGAGKRDPELYVSVISSSEEGDIVDIYDAEVLLDGFKIQNPRDRISDYLHIFDASVTVRDCYMVLPTQPGSKKGGIGIVRSTATLINIMSRNNHDSLRGGIGASWSHITIHDSTFEHNIGGGGHFHECSVFCRNTVFRNNKNGDEPQPPGMHRDLLTGGLRISGCTAVLENCQFYNNKSLNAHQIWVGEGDYSPNSLHAIHCTFVDSEPTLRSIDGNDPAATIVLENCIGWRTAKGGDFSTDIADITYSDIVGGFEGVGNIDLDPRFVNIAFGKLQLKADSPCIDAATDAGIATDLLHNPRPVDINGVGRSGENAFDMGAYEKQVLPSDLDANGYLDGNDLFLFHQQWDP